MAHKKGQGASRNGRDSNAQRRGIKCYEGETVQPGSIILRQCGSKFVAGRGTRMGMNFDIYSVVNGTVKYQGKKVHILPFGGVPVQGSPTRSTKAAKPAAPAAK